MKISFAPRTVVLIAAVLSYFLFLGTRGLNEPDEGRFAEVSWEMSQQTSWLMPHLVGVPHLQKPPLLYWITAMSIRWFGANEWAVRLPSALSALGIILLTMHLGRLLFGSAVGWKSGFILMSSGLFFVMARLITTDMLLSFWITASVVAYVHYTKRGQRLALLFFYTCLGAGFLTKGPMAFLVPLSAVIPWAIVYQPERKLPMQGWHWIPGLVIALGISASWFILLFQAYPELVDYFYQYEFVERIASNTHNRNQPFWFYSVVLFGGFLPWSFMLPRAVLEFWRRRDLRGRPALWLLAGWLLIPWITLHLVTSKLPTYILPLFPPLALVAACAWERYRARWHVEMRWFSLIFANLVALLPFMLWFNVKNDDSFMPLTSGLLVCTVLVCVGWVMLFIKTSVNDDSSKVLIRVGSMMLVSLVLFSSQVEVILRSRGKSLRPIADSIKEALSTRPDAKVVLINMRRYGLEFYLQRPLLRTPKGVEMVLPIPDRARDWYLDDPFQHMRDNPREEYLILVTRHNLPDPLPAGWNILGHDRSVYLIHRPPDHSPSTF